MSSDTLTLVPEIDLTRHVRDSAYWHLPKGTPLGKGKKGEGRLKAATPEERASRVKALSDQAKVVETLTARASKMKPGTPEYDRAWNDIADRLNDLGDHAKAEIRPKGKGRTFAGETGKEAVSTAVGQSLLGVAVKVSAAAGGILTGEESEHMQHALHAISENRLLEAATIVGVVVVINGLARRIKAGIKRLKAKRASRVLKGNPMGDSLSIPQATKKVTAPASPTSKVPAALRP